MNFRYPAGSIVGTVLRNMTQTVIGGNIATAPVRGRIVTQAPANPNASPVTNVVGVINGIGGVACNVQFRFVGQSSPIGAGSVAGKPASSDAGDEITAGLKNGASGY